MAGDFSFFAYNKALNAYVGLQLDEQLETVSAASTSMLYILSNQYHGRDRTVEASSSRLSRRSGMGRQQDLGELDTQAIGDIATGRCALSFSLCRVSDFLSKVSL